MQLTMKDFLILEQLFEMLFGYRLSLYEKENLHTKNVNFGIIQPLRNPLF